MAHTTHPVAELFDTINHEGLEWLVGYLRYPAGTWEYYQLKYATKANPGVGTAAYVWGLLWRLALTVIPVLPLLYVATRTLALAYRVVYMPHWVWRPAPIKTFFMALALLPAALMIALVPQAKVVALFTQGVSRGLLSLVPAPILALGFGTLLTATLLYTAKAAAQWVHTIIYNGKTNPKHVLSRTENNNPIHPLHEIHARHFQAYENLKKTLRENPNSLALAQGAAGAVTQGGEALSPLQYAEQSLSKGKAMFATLENVIEDHHTRCLKKQDYEQLTNNTKGLFYAWKENLKGLNRAPKMTGSDDPDMQLANYTYDTANRRLLKGS